MQQIPLTRGRYGVAISWDKGGRPVDVDIQAVIVDTAGSVVDAVYYNNMKALKCITHSGDEQTGERQGYDEIIWCGLAKMPPHVRMLIFVVAAHKGGHLRDVQNGMIHLLEEQKENEITRFAMERSQAEVDMIATMVRSEHGWTFSIINEPAQNGRHFIDILEPSIGNLIRKVIPGAPRRQKVAFAMEKGAVFDLPDSGVIRKITAGLGWDVTGAGIDLDVSAVCFDGNNQVIEAVFFGNLEFEGIKHSGDNLTGEGAGDDEQIECDLVRIPQRVQQVVLIVNIYSRGATFQQVKNAYCRVIDSQGTELARYMLKEAGHESGLMIARLFREPDGVRWGFQALGQFCKGQTYKDSIPELTAIVGKAARELQLRGASTASLGSSYAPPGPHPAPPGPHPMPPGPSQATGRRKQNKNDCHIC